MVKRLFSVCAVCCIASSSFGGEKLPLKLDYASQSKWTYLVEYESECIFSEKKQTSSKKTAISGLITGNLAESKDKLDLTAADIKVSSDLYEDETKAKVSKKLAETGYQLALKDGNPVIDTSVDLATGGLPEWDLYMQLAKLLPELPGQPVKKGLTWERQSMLPIKTPQGVVDCQVFRHFKVEKLSEEQDTAYISWKFRYSANEPKADKAQLLKHMPVAGSGKGEAEIDVNKGIITKASFAFETPVASLENAKINWKEKGTLRIKGKN